MSTQTVLLSEEGDNRVGIACDRSTMQRTVTEKALARLSGVADVVWEPFDEPAPGYAFAPPYSAESEARLIAFAHDVDALVVSKGCPYISETVLAGCPSLRLIGDLQGDRFGRRIDVAAAHARGIRVVDTTHGSSDPVAEWALGLMLIGLRNAGALFRRLIAGELLFAQRMELRSDPAYLYGELTGKTVGMIACGHIGRRLLQLLRPFGVNVLVYDPFLARDLVDALDITQTSLHQVMSESDVVVCLAPLTEGTRGLVDAAAIEALRPHSIFVNVSRGPVVDSQALVDRLSRGDVIGCLDVFDPEPFPADSVLRGLPNVFLSPHIAGVTAACGPRFFDYMVDELLRCFAGHETRYDLVPRE